MRLDEYGVIESVVRDAVTAGVALAINKYKLPTTEQYQDTIADTVMSHLASVIDFNHPRLELTGN